MIALGLFGALAGFRSRIPAGVLAGSVLGTGFASAILFSDPEGGGLPGLDTVVQILVGILVGMRLSREALRSGGSALVPSIVITFGMILLGLVAAFLTVLTGVFDPPTALFAAVPGGITEMSTVGTSLGANGASVLAVHLLRLLVTITAVNLVLHRRWPTKPSTRFEPSLEVAGASNELPERASKYGRTTMLLVVGMCGGLAGTLSELPAGGVIGALLCTTVGHLYTKGSIESRWLVTTVQAVGGIAIGSRITREFLFNLPDLIGASLFLVGVQLLFWIVCNHLLRSVFSYDHTTALFASAPGGMGELVATAANTDADLSLVTFFHLVRLSLIIAVIPLLSSVLFT